MSPIAMPRSSGAGRRRDRRDAAARHVSWGDRYGVIIDPAGHKWALATHIKDVTPEEMQAAMKAMFSKKP